MKNYTSSLRVLLPLLFVFVLASCSGRHYKHARGIAEADKIAYTKAGHQKISKTEPTTARYLETVPVTTPEQPELVSNEKQVSTTQKHEPVVHQQKAQTQQKEVKNKPLLDVSTFTQKMKKHERVMKVQDVEKTAIIGWILGMILLFVGFVIFIALALVFLYIIASYVPYTIFLIIAIVLGVAAVLFLILGLADVFTPGV